MAHFDLDLLLTGKYHDWLVSGLRVSLQLAGSTLLLALPLAVLLALPLGTVLGLARVSPFRLLRWPVTVLVYGVRGLPLLMVIFWAHFFLPALTGQKTGQFSTMLTALVVFDAVYLAEIVRAGIQGIPKGQFESARSAWVTASRCGA